MFTITIIVIFVFLIIFSFFIEDSNLKLCYWLVVMLLSLSAFNIILSYTYYNKLRNEPGVPGTRGPQGVQGAKGPSGVCSISAQCHIGGCKEKIVNMAHEVFPKVKKSCLSNVGRCGREEAQIGKPLASLIKRLTYKCQRSKLAEPDFMKRIRPSLVRLQVDGDMS
jgi:hypothetical protein